MKNNTIKEIIELVLDEVINRGWDLIDDYQINPQHAIDTVYSNIKDNIF